MKGTGGKEDKEGRTIVSNIKIETPPSPQLEWPPMPISRYQSIDPNEFVWSPRYAPSPI